ncbi:hypothetical protein P3T37_007130 [Kitasatospora sp. MAA4]|uniref:hypothetical protein n=1 Tax=Kitasatospora sp. MAA4 TaxID=3035093 RepID=UPI0024755988|nr:hypothetical protein [Kitasatospora sp. MAA4]MDH6137697.1 hypothetical protein [Kitasatospora sp. MAA4]
MTARAGAGSRSRSQSRWWLTGAVLSLAASAVLFGYGALSGFTRAGKLCALAAGRSPSDLPDGTVEQTLLPLSHVCRWRDGTSVDLVPGWLNPLLALCLAAAIGCVVLAVRSARTPSEEPS